MKIKKFFHNLKQELGKVKWPTFKEVGKNTTSTLLFCIFFGLFFYLIDIAFAAVVRMFN